ncbi:hypothetical protein CY652_04630 [Burkholderia sp. WAC0059]|uniref:hypothetical protein n=1 Tax=Burkholderia sp. WAC0059 TaxID=2066022 RepID=UPI000C7ED10C|nr:hypothetical protein [Burkholderia sp. WAC0059]PLZ03673.1 hypothetical protein CY652_04630 [Burkholderia sp. WAC0059]
MSIRHVRAVVFAVSALAVPPVAFAQQGAQSTQPAQPVRQRLEPNPEFAHFPRYAGTLGKRRIVLRLGPQTQAGDPGGLRGEYQFVDTGEVVLIAGDREGDTLEAEESDDGTNIAGNWVGTFAADGSLSGDRMNVDDSDPQPFDLHPLAAGTPVPAAGGPVPPDAVAPGAAVPATDGQASPADAAPRAVAPVDPPAASPPANPVPPGPHPVGGVGNLTTDD